MQPSVPSRGELTPRVVLAAAGAALGAAAAVFYLSQLLLRRRSAREAVEIAVVPTGRAPARRGPRAGRPLPKGEG
jgi:hypothetical protein